MSAQIPRTACLVLVVFLVPVFGGCLAAPGNGSDASGTEHGSDASCAEDTQEYLSESDAFSLCVPAGWVIEEDLFGAVVALYREADQGEDFVANVNVYTEPAAPGEQLDESREDVLEALPRFITDWELEHEGPTELGGRPAHEFRHHGRQGEFQLSFHQVLRIQDGTAYAWTHTVQRHSGDLDDPDARTILRSFTFQ